MAAHERSAFERGIAREAAGDVAVDVAAEGAADLAADVGASVFAQLPWIGATPRVRERVVEGAAEGAGKRTVAAALSLSLSREASARLARELGLGLGSGRGRGSQNGVDLRHGGNPLFSPGTADGPRRIPRLRAQTSARVALAGLTIFASLATSLLHEPATRGSLPASVRSGGARESLQSRGGAPRGAGAMNRKQVLAAVIGVGAVTTGAAAQNAVQWRVEDGGNGHWYQLHSFQGPTTRSSALEFATARNAALACLETEPENRWVASAFTGAMGLPVGQAWIGGVRTNGVWRWETGGLIDFLAWNCNHCHPTCQPDYTCEDFLAVMCIAEGVARFNNLGDCLGTGEGQALLEWSADCNSDGIVDYGQILAGELEDTNANGVPDCCDAGTSCNCPADIDGNGDVNGIDLAIILDKWGTNGGKDYPNADIDGDGTIAGADLAEVLGNWGACR
jgi:hypothetical protein